MLRLKAKSSKNRQREVSFEDQSGSIDIEIDDKDWRGLVVGPDDVVIIEGEVDKGWTKLEIEVDNIRKAN